MWPTLERARRRISGGTTAPTTKPAEAEPTDAPPVTGLLIVRGGPELDQLRLALQRLQGPSAERPDTPARIEQALKLLIAKRGGAGDPRVLRRPAGVSTPEAWEIHLDGVDSATVDAIRTATRSGRF
jgi:hypothetical protein